MFGWVFFSMKICFVRVVKFSSSLMVIKLGISGVKMVVNLVRNFCIVLVCLFFSVCFFFVVMLVSVGVVVGVVFSRLFIILVVVCVLLGLSIIWNCLLLMIIFIMLLIWWMVVLLVRFLLCRVKCRCVM